MSQQFKVICYTDKAYYHTCHFLSTIENFNQECDKVAVTKKVAKTEQTPTKFCWV